MPIPKMEARQTSRQVSPLGETASEQTQGFNFPRGETSAVLLPGEGLGQCLIATRGGCLNANNSPIAFTMRCYGC